MCLTDLGWLAPRCGAAAVLFLQSELKRAQDQLASRMVEFDEALTRRDTKAGATVDEEEVRVLRDWQGVTV